MSEHDGLDAEFVRTVREGLVPRVADSYVCATISPKDPTDIDVKFAVELGVMIMLDKPIIAICVPGGRIPSKLRQVADEVIAMDVATDEGQAALMAAVERIKQKYPDSEGGGQ